MIVFVAKTHEKKMLGIKNLWENLRKIQEIYETTRENHMTGREARQDENKLKITACKRQTKYK